MIDKNNMQLSFGGLDKVEIERLCDAGLRVYRLMSDGKWRTLREISEATQMSEAGASARLRDFRKPAFGSHTVEKRKRYENTYEYRLITATPFVQYKLGVIK